MKTAQEFFNEWASKNIEVKGGSPKTYELLPQQIFNCMDEYIQQCIDLITPVFEAKDRCVKTEDLYEVLNLLRKANNEIKVFEYDKANGKNFNKTTK